MATRAMTPYRAESPAALRVLDLFSGIGGFSLGLERTGGFKTVAFCEIEPFCRRVLAKHWPDVPCFEDVRALKGSDVEAIDVICGGFPCQDISSAGKREGIGGQRSGLWAEYARLVGEVQPRFVLVENVAALLGRGLGVVLGDLAALRYDAEWHCIPASAAGAPHIRDRVWIIAYPQHPDANSIGPHREAGDVRSVELGHEQGRYAGPLRALLADVAKLQRDGGRVHAGSDREGARSVSESGVGGSSISNADSKQARRPAIARQEHCGWSVEPDVGRVAHGVPSRVDRLRGLGNAVVPQIPEAIGRAILAAEDEMRPTNEIGAVAEPQATRVATNTGGNHG